MMLLQMLFSLIREGFPPGDSKIALMHVPDRPQFGNNSVEGGIILDDDVDINDRLCGQPRNGSAADMLDPQGQFSNCILYFVSDIQEVLLPFPRIRLDDDMLCSHASIPHGTQSAHPMFLFTYRRGSSA